MEPATWAVAGALAIQGLSGITGYGAARSQYRHEKKLFNKSAELIRQGTRDAYADNLLRALQELQAIREHLMDSQLERMRAQGAAEVEAGEAGVMGASVDALLRDLRNQQSRADERSRLNYDMSMSQLARERVGIRNQALSQFYSLRMPQKPSAFAYALRTAGDMMNTYMAAGGRGGGG